MWEKKRLGEIETIILSIQESERILLFSAEGFIIKLVGNMEATIFICYIQLRPLAAVSSLK